MTMLTDAEIAEIRERFTWQPIETVPKDGSRVLIYNPRCDHPVYEAYWARPFEVAPDNQCWWQAADGDRTLSEHALAWIPIAPPPPDNSFSRLLADREALLERMAELEAQNAVLQMAIYGITQADGVLKGGDDYLTKYQMIKLARTALAKAEEKGNG